MEPQQRDAVTGPGAQAGATDPQAGTGTAAAETGWKGTLALSYPPSGPDGYYTQMQHDFIGEIAVAAARKGYDLLLSPGNHADDASFQRLLGERRAAGVIIMETRIPEDDRIEALTEAGFPFVTIGYTTQSDRSSWVKLDFAAMAGACVRYLADLGHRRIAFVNRPEGLFKTGYESAVLGLEGFTGALTELGLGGQAYMCEDDAASGEACLEQILRDDAATTAIVTMNEAALGGVYLGLTRAGRAVPRDFSLVGVAAGRWAEQATPKLTAADVPAREQSQVAVDLLVERLTSPDAPLRRVVLTSLLSVRASTGPCRPLPETEPGPGDLRGLEDLGDLEF
ncbi:substrate-binding domain-containing protein [Streptomyces sp. AS02]|uniref:LacI family DNA-binding transcriptional regulator n=1 Tax=Streptomyces sp. AS02 TaxID=2938946 RepID=UPI00201FC948|nr:substrate-binding domain-containing protein [Streptomyces sp. AS02]MCL8014909.1 substrate-binding domain-containing protein [Streptomyces sp. AS02]